jgi:hypothetical protein
MVAALRSYLRRVPDGLERCGRLRGHLALLLPELGDAVAGSDRATLFESIRCGVATIAARHPTFILLDDLHGLTTRRSSCWAPSPPRSARSRCC